MCEHKKLVLEQQFWYLDFEYRPKPAKACFICGGVGDVWIKEQVFNCPKCKGRKVEDTGSFQAVIVRGPFTVGAVKETFRPGPHGTSRYDVEYWALEWMGHGGHSLHHFRVFPSYAAAVEGAKKLAAESEGEAVFQEVGDGEAK